MRFADELEKVPPVHQVWDKNRILETAASYDAPLAAHPVGEADRSTSEAMVLDELTTGSPIPAPEMDNTMALDTEEEPYWMYPALSLVPYMLRLPPPPGSTIEEQARHHGFMAQWAHRVFTVADQHGDPVSPNE